MKRKEALWRSATLAGPALLPSSIVFLVGAHTIYAWNSGEFSLPFVRLAVPGLLTFVAVSWVCLTLPGVLLAERWRERYVAMVFGVGVLLWAQGNLWVGDYGLLDGSEIDFDALAWRSPYELAAWVVGLTLAFVFSRHVAQIAPLASVLFVGLQLGAMAIGPDSDHRAQWADTPPEIYRFSSERNVILIVLDEFQADLFKELAERDRASLDERFGGFVFFSNHAGAFPTTSLSMPAMLTGQAYANDRPVPEFVRGAFERESIFEKLRRRGYAIDVLSILSPEWIDDWFPSNHDAAADTLRFTIQNPFVGADDYRRFTALQLVELSVFRHVPHLAKKALNEHPEWPARLVGGGRGSLASERRHVASSARAFLEQYNDRVALGRDGPVLKLIHLGIPHRPVVVDEDCDFVGFQRFSRESFLGQSACALDLMAALLDRLRELGIHDESLIVISSDHGTALAPRGFEGAERSFESANLNPARLQSITGTALPLMLIKPPRASGPLTISEAPTAHTDLPATIADLLGLPPPAVGQSMLGLDPTVGRRRVYRMYEPRQRFPKGHLNRLDLFAIDGNLLAGDAWSYQRSIHPPGLRLEARTVDLGEDDRTPHLGPGWSRGRTEKADGRTTSFVRGLGRRAVLFLSLPKGAAELTLRMSASDGHDTPLSFEIDGRVVERVNVRGRRYHDVVCRIPPDPDRPAISTLVLRREAKRSVRVDRLSLTAP